MSPDEFLLRWKTLDYDKLSVEGKLVDPPAGSEHLAARRPYGRNGKGRHASFRFSDPYFVRTWKDGTEIEFQVKRGVIEPFDVREISRRDGVEGHGTEVRAAAAEGVSTDPDAARRIIGTRFLADPNFSVTLNGVRITFEDIPNRSIRQYKIGVPPFGAVELIQIDTERVDRNTKQHGIAWRVGGRLVGTPSWAGFGSDRLLDGRTSEARRFLFIIRADYLIDDVLADWSGFKPESKCWQDTQLTVHDNIRRLLSEYTVKKRQAAKSVVRSEYAKSVQALPLAGRTRWMQFVDQVIDACPSISVDEVGQVAGILANLEAANSRYGLLTKLHELDTNDLDALNQMLDDWTMRAAKEALDEIQSRLRLIQELEVKLNSRKMDEVADLQPLFYRSLWVFGPEFESIEFTSNKGMTSVIKKIFKSDDKGSLQRPDFVIVPDGSASVGAYSRDSHDEDGEVNGVSRLVIVEIKRVGVPIGAAQKNQAWGYVKELTSRGFIDRGTKVSCFVLGHEIEDGENDPVTHGSNVTVTPMIYNVFIKKAEKRMLGLRQKLAEAPFLKEYLEVDVLPQTELDV